MIRTGRKNYPAIILNETEMRMILDSLVEDDYVIGHKSEYYIQRRFRNSKRGFEILKTSLLHN